MGIFTIIKRICHLIYNCTVTCEYFSNLINVMHVFNQVCAGHRPVHAWFFVIAFCSRSLCVYVCVFMCMCSYVCSCVCFHVCMCVHVCVCVYVSVCVSVSVSVLYLCLCYSVCACMRECVFMSLPPRLK